jgi:hypothetical protein
MTATDPGAPALDPSVARAARRAFIWRALVAFGVFLVLAAVETYPLILRLGTHVCCDIYDPLMLEWVLAWDVHALRSGNLLHLFDANMFYPAEASLAFSEHLLGVVPLFAPGYLLTGNAIVGYNIVLLLSFALSGVSMFCLAYYGTRQFWPSLAAGTLFGFALYRFGQISHLQLLNIFWAPLAFVFLDRFLRARRWRDLIGLAVFYWLQILSSVYLGYMVSVGLGLYAAYHALVVDRRGLLRWSVLAKALAFLGASAAVLLPLHLPYLAVHESWRFERSLSEVMYFSPSPWSYLSGPLLMNDVYLSVFHRLELPAPWEKWLFPGLVLIALVLMGSAGRIDALPREGARHVRRVYWLIVAAGFVLSLGPYLHLDGKTTRVPLPYLLLYHVVPGFPSMRVPGRFALLVLLAAGPIAALGAIRFAAVLGRRLGSAAPAASALTAIVVIGLALGELGWKPFPLVAVPGDEQTRQLYGYLALTRPGPIVELPFGFREEYAYVYFSTAHWLPLVNGLSSFAPSMYDDVRTILEQLPDRTALRYAEALGVRAIVLHEKGPVSAAVARGRDEEAARLGITKVAEFGPHVVYAIPEVPVSRRLSVEPPIPPSLPAGQPLRLGLLARPEDGMPWRNPGPHGWRKGVVEWTDVPTGRSKKFTTRFLVPPVVLGDATWSIPSGDAIPIPDKPGSYAIRVSIPALGLHSEVKTVEIRSEGFPTSLDSPHLLAAAYAGARTAPITVLRPAPIRLEIVAINVGAARWLAAARKDRGAVRLAWRWRQDGRELVELAGRAPLPYDVFPGQHAQFVASIVPPRKAGHYTLEIGLVSELVTMFEDQGTPPITLPVQVWCCD